MVTRTDFENRMRLNRNRRMKKIIFLCVLFAAGTPPTGTTANDGKTQDAGLWVFAGVSHSPHGGKWNMLYGLEYRSRNHFRTTDLWSVSANVNYIFNPLIQIGAGYEFFLNRNAGGRYSPEHRYYPEAILSGSRGDFSASFRSRLMNTFTRPDKPHWEGRNRLKISYAIRGTGLKPFVAAEPYHAIYPVAFLFRKIRYSAGCSVALDRRQNFDLYYLREDYLHDSFLRHVIQVAYNFNF
jgi:hypothetical protein